MFNVSLWLIVIGICLPGLWLMSVHTAVVMTAKPDNKISRKTANGLSEAPGKFFGRGDFVIE